MITYEGHPQKEKNFNFSNQFPFGWNYKVVFVKARTDAGRNRELYADYADV